MKEATKKERVRIKRHFLHCCNSFNTKGVNVVVYFILNLKYRVVLCGSWQEKALIFTLSYKM